MCAPPLGWPRGMGRVAVPPHRASPPLASGVHPCATRPQIHSQVRPDLAVGEVAEHHHASPPLGSGVRGSYGDTFLVLWPSTTRLPSPQWGATLAPPQAAATYATPLVFNLQFCNTLAVPLKKILLHMVAARECL